ncbi:MAG: MBL fold metallo-hydrolase, partial [Acidaminococcaceae bacterium]|nr:MBL fold metallo-hydrolase [Acidaminococcaceae bacterium]
MEIIIHRGTHQIGGCVTEIKTEKARIIIDMGAPLPGSKTENEMEEGKDSVLSLPGVTVTYVAEDGTDINENGQAIGAQPCDAVFITHYHGDHIGMIDALLPEISLYIGKAAKEIYNIYCTKTEQIEKVKRLQAAHAYTPGQPIQIKNITVTPFHTSHSALDAYMLLIEAEGKTVLHTGDFSLHGVKGNQWLYDLKAKLSERNIASIDYLICEGTMLPDQVRTSPTELDVIGQIDTLMKKYKKVFVLCSSTHIDRIAEFYHHRRYHAPLVSDLYQNIVLQYVTKTFGKEDYFYRLRYAYTHFINDETCVKYKTPIENPKLLSMMDEYGFVALIRPNYWSKWMLAHYYDEADSAIVYSMWSGYLKEGPAKNEYLCDFLKPYK